MTARTFQIDMPGDGSKLFADSVVKSAWKFGAIGQEVGLQESETDSTPVPSITIERDKMYTVTVTGDHNQKTLKAWISDVKDIPAGELGAW